MLEQQLEKTRVMVLQAERDRAEALRRMAALQADNAHVDNAERRSYIDKISDLEREQLKLMATQTLAQVTPEMLVGLLLILSALLGVPFYQRVYDLSVTFCICKKGKGRAWQTVLELVGLVIWIGRFRWFGLQNVTMTVTASHVVQRWD